jgi:hypothetical protein
MPFQNGNKAGLGNNGGRPQKKIRLYQAEVGLSTIVPYLKEHNIIPKALQNVGEMILSEPKTITEKRERLYWSGWAIDKFLPKLHDIELTAEMKHDYGEKVNELFGDICARLPRTRNYGGDGDTTKTEDVPK